MIPPVIYARFGVCSNVCDSAQLRKNLGGRDPPAACGSAPRADRPRPAWCTTTWPQMLRLATARTALRRLGDAAACPQGGPRSSTGARPGHQPRGKTSGQRQGAHVVGVRESCTGRFGAQGQAGRRIAATSRAWLPRVWAPLTPPLRLMQDGATYPTSLALPRVCARHTERGLVFPWPSASPAEQPSAQLWKNVTKAGTPFPYGPTVQARPDTVEHALLTCATTPKASRALCRLPTEVAQVASVRLGRKSLS